MKAVSFQPLCSLAVCVRNGVGGGPWKGRAGWRSRGVRTRAVTGLGAARGPAGDPPPFPTVLPPFQPRPYTLQFLFKEGRGCFFPGLGLPLPSGLLLVSKKSSLTGPQGGQL